MKIICVDDEVVVLNHTVYLCQSLPQKPQVIGFSKTKDALESIKEQEADIALLDIDMPDMNGLALAARIKELSPDTSIIFLTGYSEFAADAFRLHASGYLLKPLDKQALEEEINYAMRMKPQKEPEADIVVRTFGDFDVFVNGEAVLFSRSKAKELLAFLVDRQGSSVSKKTIFASLWEDETYDRSKQKYLSIIIASMFETLEEYGISYIVKRQRGVYRICPEKIDCDMYRFFEGDVEAVNSYRGQYMNSYQWAVLSEAKLTRETE